MVLNTKMQARVIRNEFPYVIPLYIDETICPIVKKENESIVLTVPKPDEKTINLEDVKIVNNYKKEVLTHKTEMNFTASGYKIDDHQYGTFLDFLIMHGYRTGIDPETNDVYIQSNRVQMGGTPHPPSIYVDNDLVYDFNFLFNLNLQDVDEVYIDQTSNSDISGGGNGTIKVFLKLDRHKNDYFNIKYTSLIVTKGFSDTFEFKNTVFDTQEGFYNFGTLSWSPSINLTENPNFAIKFPRGNQKEIRVLFEGFSMDGQLISEIKTIPVSN
jgi:hypothetical protein